MRKAIKILIWIVLPLVLIILALFTYQWNLNRTVKEVNIAMDYEYFEEVTELINTNDISNILASKFHALEGKPIKSLELEAMEKTLEANPYIKSADAFVSLSAELFFRIQQRKPIVRVIDQSGEHYYIDSEEHWVPTRTLFPARVLICNGIIPYMGFNRLNLRLQTRDSLVENTVLHSIYKLATYINADTFLRMQIVQMYVDEKQEFYLIPLVGSHIIEFGKAEEMEKKFNKLKIFYTQGLGHHKWNNYRKINIKFENQIVCTKI